MAVTNSSNIGVRASTKMEYSALHPTEIPIFDELRVWLETQFRSDFEEVACDRGDLVSGHGEDVGESAAAREACCRNLLQFLEWGWGSGVLEAIPLCAAHREDVRASAGEVDLEDLA